LLKPRESPTLGDDRQVGMTKTYNRESENDLARLEQSPKTVASWQSAQQHLIGGRHVPALASYRNLTQQFPGVSQLWAEMSIAAAGNLDFPLADQTSQRAAELASADANLLVSIGQHYHRLRRLEQAGTCFEQAVAADPDSVHAQLSLAAWYERDRRLDDAWNCVETCLASHPHDGRALYFKAFLLHRKGHDGEVETALRDLLKSADLPADARCSASHLLGVVLDSVGQYGEALAWLEKAKNLQRQMSNTTALESTYVQMDRSRRELLASLTPDMIKRWREQADAAATAHPLALLGGTPRSGTTLIEQIFGAHPDVLVFDEPESFANELMNPLYPPPPARGLSVKALNTLPPDRRGQMTRRYFKSLLRELPQTPCGKMLIDKNPSLTAALYVWLRLFPQLKVIIALRDPRDIVISCYFQSLALTPGNVNFLSLPGAVKYYADCMDVWLRLRELGGFDWIETRYEDVVNNLEAEGKRVTHFLGLQWNDAQAKYHEKARSKFVFAPTYHDVTKPVYKNAIGRWEHYQDAMAPLHSRLEPYCKAFGYNS